MLSVDFTVSGAPSSTAAVFHVPAKEATVGAAGAAATAAAESGVASSFAVQAATAATMSTATAKRIVDSMSVMNLRGA